MAIRHHHEHWDGNGYPSGRSREQIPLGPRILAVADAFDAMTSNRPYRKALPQSVAIDELKTFSGVQFDPVLVKEFLGCLETAELDQLLAGHAGSPVKEPAPAPA
jgi:HD-GYP domain-containing protein (c-di-GMP phosphodiesterase class II)